MPNTNLITEAEVAAMKTKLDEELSHRGGQNSIGGLQGWQNGSAAPVMNSFITEEQADGLGKTFEVIDGTTFNPTKNLNQFSEVDWTRMKTGVDNNYNWDYIMPASGTKEAETYIADGSSGCRTTCQGLCSNSCFGGCQNGCGQTCTTGCTGGDNSINTTIHDYEAAGPDDSGCEDCGSACGGTCADTCTGFCSKGCSGACATSTGA